ncbi:hypothetical protein RB195_023420 [Necator americanus]|uniref:Mos1 transposase HTH domain-containing protein n=1 Tax=Necator americanus TaxID=51031 RepID=A0ABR1EJ94_NECAM
MAEHSTHIRHILLYEFEFGHPAAEAHRNLSQVFGPEASSERSVRACFQSFKTGDKKFEDEPRSGRPTAISLTNCSIHMKVCDNLLPVLAVRCPP